MGKGGACHCQGWFDDVGFICFPRVFLAVEVFVLNQAYVCVCVYKPTFSWCICSNYTGAAQC